MGALDLHALARRAETKARVLALLLAVGGAEAGAILRELLGELAPLAPPPRHRWVTGMEPEPAPAPAAKAVSAQPTESVDAPKPRRGGRPPASRIRALALLASGPLTSAEIFDRLGGTSLASWYTMLGDWRRGGLVVRDEHGRYSLPGAAPVADPEPRPVRPPEPSPPPEPAPPLAPIEPLPEGAARAAVQAHLLARIARGDHAAWAPFWADVERFVFQQLGRHGIRPDEQADAAQDVQIRVFAQASTYDPSKGGALTWLGWQVRAVLREIRERRETIRLPQKAHEMVGKLRRGEVRLEDLGPFERQRIEAALATRRTASLDAPVGDDDSMTLADAISANHNVADQLVDAIDERRSETPALLREWRDGLRKRERLIYDHRIACHSDDAWTLQQVGDAAGVTRECIRQCEVKQRRELRAWLAERIDREMVSAAG